MLLQTNSYVVPKEKRAEHARLVRKFRQTLGRLGCEQFDVFEQVGPNWGGGETTGRFVQMMRFRDRKHQVAVQTAEKQDPAAQALIQEFCDLINFGYQQQQGLFAVGYYQSTLPVAPQRLLPLEGDQSPPQQGADEHPAGGGHAAEQDAGGFQGGGGGEVLVGGSGASATAGAGAGAAETANFTDGEIDLEAAAAEALANADAQPSEVVGLRRVDDDTGTLGADDLELEVDLSDATNNGEEPRPPSSTS